MSLRPAGSKVDWSNKIQINFSSKVSTTTSINMTDYVKMIPGWTYIYNSTNNLAGGKTGITRLQMEQKISKCGINMIPWRFTKSNEYVYWGHYMPSVSNGQKDLRWFIVDPSYTSKYDSYIWGFGHSIYSRKSNDSSIRDIYFNSIATSDVYRTASEGNTPSYNISPKTITQLPLNTLRGAPLTYSNPVQLQNAH